MPDSTTPVSKVCTKCGAEKPLTPEYFHEQKTGKYGFTAGCKACAHARQAVYRLANLEKIRIQQTAWKQANPEKIAAWHAANSERLAVKNRARYASDPAPQAKASRKWVAKNAESIAAKGRKWYALNIERVTANHAAWKAAHPESLRVYYHRRRARKLAVPGAHTADDIKRIYAEQHGLCAYCGCDLEGTGYHVDHVVPLTRPDASEDPENLVCACPLCNTSKSTKLLEEWYPARFASLEVLT